MNVISFDTYNRVPLWRGNRVKPGRGPFVFSTGDRTGGEGQEGGDKGWTRGVTDESRPVFVLSRPLYPFPFQEVPGPCPITESGRPTLSTNCDFETEEPHERSQGLPEETNQPVESGPL